MVSLTVRLIASALLVFGMILLAWEVASAVAPRAIGFVGAVAALAGGVLLLSEETRDR